MGGESSFGLLPQGQWLGVVIEQLGRAWLKRPGSMHLILVPRVMTGQWRRHLFGALTYARVDSNNMWPLKDHFEPLLIYVCLSYLSCSLRLTKKGVILEELQGALLGDQMQEMSEV